MTKTFVIDADICYIIRAVGSLHGVHYFCGGRTWCPHPWHAAVYRTVDVAAEQISCIPRPADVVLDVCTLAGSIADFEKATKK